jgi:hypothetical protein
MPGTGFRGRRFLPAVLALAGLVFWESCATSKPPPNPPAEPASELAVGKARLPCGLYRWRIKTLADPEAQSIQWKPIDTTIRDLVSMTSPAWFDRRKRNSNEFSVYRVRAILAKVHRNLDQDYHLELRDPDDPRARLVAEIPSPSCAKATARYSELKATRLTAKALRARSSQALVEVVGVGFFDRLHKPRGGARNRFELHPVLEITEIQEPVETEAAP